MASDRNDPFGVTRTCSFRQIEKQLVYAFREKALLLIKCIVEIFRIDVVINIIIASGGWDR